jgi:hypothetical protein
LGKVAKKRETWDLCGQLSDVLYFNIFSFMGWWRIGLNCPKQQLVELGSGNMTVTVLKHHHRRFEDFQGAGTDF